MKSKKAVAEALLRRVRATEALMLRRVKKRMKELSKDKKLQEETTKELQKRFKV